jgi:hypothetical protein
MVIGLILLDPLSVSNVILCINSSGDNPPNILKSNTNDRNAEKKSITHEATNNL